MPDENINVGWGKREVQIKKVARPTVKANLPPLPDSPKQTIRTTNLNSQNGSQKAFIPQLSNRT